MKKFYLVIAIMAAVVSGAKAQNQTVLSSRFFDNMYISFTVAGSMQMGDLNSDILKNPVYPSANLYIGKWITPIFGLEINEEALFHNSFKENDVIADGNYLGMNALFNLNNIFHGYKGRPDMCEVIPFVGAGWMRAFGTEDVAPLRQVLEQNGVGFKAGINLAFNLGKARAWQINIRPACKWVACRSCDNNSFDLNKKFGRLSVEAGFTYKFKNHYGTNNFVKAQLRDQAEIDALNDRINYLNEELAKKPKEVVKTVTKEVAVAANNETSFVIPFDKGKDVVKGDISGIAAELKKTSGTINITGNTSPEGSEKVNKALAIRRAEAAKKALVNAGVDESRIKVLNSYEDKRNAIIKVVK